MGARNPAYTGGGAYPDSYFTISLSVDDSDDRQGSAAAAAGMPSAKGEEEEVFRFTFETFVTIFTTFVCVVGNSLILIVAARTTAFDNFNRCYLFSLTTADLFLGLFVTPFCIFNTMYGKWIFDSSIFCCVEAYLMALFILVRRIRRRRRRACTF